MAKRRDAGRQTVLGFPFCVVGYGKSILTDRLPVGNPISPDWTATLTARDDAATRDFSQSTLAPNVGLLRFCFRAF